jgi:branched-chain amino acid aminotransferase
MQPWPELTSAVIVPWVRNERSAIAGAKSTSYAENVVALAWAKERGYSEGVFLNTVGQICEGTGTNVFAVIDGTLITPPLSSGALAGITRELVLEWCDAREEHLAPADLDRADEIFLTSSTRDVHPVTQWNERTWDGIGNITAHAQAEFAHRSAATADP